MRSRTVNATADEATVLGAVTDLYRHNRRKSQRVRLLGVALSNLVADRDGPQLWLPFDRAPRVGTVIDQVRTKFGYDSVHFGQGTALAQTRGRGAPSAR